jgi:hypothetical protein
MPVKASTGFQFCRVDRPPDDHAASTTDPRERSSSGPIATDAFDRVLFPARLHAGLRDGSIDLALRSRARPTVEQGGTLLSPPDSCRSTGVHAERPQAQGVGLTESLGVGYRLSPRGSRYLGLRPDGPVAPT